MIWHNVSIASLTHRHTTVKRRLIVTMTNLFSQQASLFPAESNATSVATPPAQPMVTDVLVNADGSGFNTYTYLIPSHLTETPIQQGMAVDVSFGRKDHVTGYVLAVRPKTADDPYHCKPVQAILSDTPLIDKAHWSVLAEISRYTVTPLATTVQAALPPKLIGTSRTIVQANQQKLAGIPITSFDSTAKTILTTLLNIHSNTLTPNALLKRSGLDKRQFNNGYKALKAHQIISEQPEWQQASQGRLITVITPQAPLSPGISLTPKQQTAYNQILDEYQRIQLPVAKKSTDASDSILKALVSKQAITTEQIPEKSLQTQEIISANLPKLTAEQQAVYNTIINHENSTDDSIKNKHDPWLIYGVTGSGKTAVYLHLFHHAITQGKQALLLVPEIALTTQLAQRVRSVFPNAGVWHSNIAEGERIQLWQALRSGKPMLMLGARSAALLPLSHAGIIVMDEAHDGSFKQESPAPRYHAEMVTRTWCQHTGATLVLGSATPDIATMTEAQTNGKLLTLTQRYGKFSQLATVTCIDMQDACKPHNVAAFTNTNTTKTAEQTNQPTTDTTAAIKPTLVAPQTLQALRDTINEGQQAIVLINRRGYHTLIQCQTCGHTHQCSDCDVALTYHRPQRASSTATPKAAYVLCHHCGFQASAPDYCAHCASRNLRLMGTGSQRVVEALEQALPGARIARLDRDTQQKRHAPEALLTAFANHQSDILVGTQMIAKGLDIANVTLVAVLQADSALLLPDYRASERAFQLLTQVAGRAGRGDLAGRVLIQTWQPDHPVIQLAAQQHYDGFLDYERPIREKLGFPPFAQLYRFVISGEDDTLAMATAKGLVARINEGLGQFPNYPVQVLGPAPCVISRVQGWYRFHVLIKVLSMEAAIRDDVHGVLSDIAKGATNRTGLRILLDVDAMSLL
jgi:primosomal protein N' (replication factor Y)